MVIDQYLSLSSIIDFLNRHKRASKNGSGAIGISEIARRAGISRQTVYALMRNSRSEFGESAQIRLSRVIQQISADPAYPQGRVMRIDLSGGAPRIRFGGTR